MFVVLYLVPEHNGYTAGARVEYNVHQIINNTVGVGPGDDHDQNIAFVGRFKIYIEATTPKPHGFATRRGLCLDRMS